MGLLKIVSHEKPKSLLHQIRQHNYLGKSCFL